MTDTECTLYPWLFECTANDDLTSVKDFLNSMSRELRQKIVNIRYDGDTLLFLASVNGYAHFIDYFIDECGANTEELGFYHISGDTFSDEVTPLWAAAVANKLEAVKSLVRHGANVNGASFIEKSTAVKTACRLSNVEVVKYLISCDADIHRPDTYGVTCLMSSTQSAELCQLLLEHRANINDLDRDKNSALHYAIKNSRLDITKILVENGADLHVKNEFGDDPLQAACVNGCEDIVIYLVEKTDASCERTADSVDVIGAYLIDRGNVLLGLDYWCMHFEANHQKSVRSTLASQMFGPEFKTRNELYFLTLSDPDQLHLQSLMVRERILGPMHRDTASGAQHIGIVLAKKGKFDMCISVWLYALELRHKHCPEPLSYITLNIRMLSLIWFFWNLWTQFEDIHYLPRFNDIYRLIEMILEEVEASSSATAENDTAALLILYLVNLLIKMTLTPDEELLMKRMIYKFIKLRIKSGGYDDVLHLICDHESSNKQKVPYSILADSGLLKVLLECGADPNSVNARGDTPLHVLGTSIEMDFANAAAYKSLVKLLIEANAHMDVRNSEGVVAYDRLKQSGCSFIFNHVALLQCLAARCIVENNVGYSGELPVHLEKFTSIH